jgi:hypothetical protein
MQQPKLNKPFLPLLVILLVFCLLSVSKIKDTGDYTPQSENEIDAYALQTDHDLNNYRRVHRKSMDCFGTDTYYKDSINIVKLHNYQSCFMIDFYYKNDQLYMARIYYDNGQVIKKIESGAKPCCKILPNGIYRKAIDFDNKAGLFLKFYGHPQDWDNYLLD